MNEKVTESFPKEKKRGWLKIRKSFGSVFLQTTWPATPRLSAKAKSLSDFNAIQLITAVRISGQPWLSKNFRSSFDDGKNLCCFEAFPRGEGVAAPKQALFLLLLRRCRDGWGQANLSCRRLSDNMGVRSVSSCHTVCSWWYHSDIKEKFACPHPSQCRSTLLFVGFHRFQNVWFRKKW